MLEVEICQSIILKDGIQDEDLKHTQVRHERSDKSVLYLFVFSLL